MVDLINHPGMFLNAEAAASLKRFEDDHGIQPINEAGRTVEKQQGYIDAWDRGGPENRPPNLYEPARPPETSEHVKKKGNAVDTPNWQYWRKYAASYGWLPDFLWDVVHFGYHPDKDQYKNRVENDMGTLEYNEESYQAFAKMQQRAFFYDVRRNGLGPDGRLGPSVFEMLAAADDSAEVNALSTMVGPQLTKLTIAVSGLATPDLNIDAKELAAELRKSIPSDTVKAIGQALLNG